MPEQLRAEPKDLGKAATTISHFSFLIVFTPNPEV